MSLTPADFVNADDHEEAQRIARALMAACHDCGGTGERVPPRTYGSGLVPCWCPLGEAREPSLLPQPRTVTALLVCLALGVGVLLAVALFGRT